MLVGDRMTRRPVTVPEDASVNEALHLIRSENIRRLPVLDKHGRLVGIVSEKDLLYASPSPATSLSVYEIPYLLSRIKMRGIMAQDVITVTEDATLEEAARIMIEKKVSGLPVVKEGVVIGIITETDLLAQLTNLLGWSVCGVRVTVRVPDKTGEFAKITSAIASQGWGIYAAGGVPAPKHPGYWDAVFKVRDVPRDDLVAVLEKIEGQEIVDVREV